MKRVLIAACMIAIGTGCGTSSSSQRAASAADHHVYVCHGNKKPKWIRVAAPAAAAHRRHGDFVSTIARKESSSCGDGLAVDKQQRSSRP